MKIMYQYANKRELSKKRLKKSGKQNPTQTQEQRMFPVFDA